MVDLTVVKARGLISFSAESTASLSSHFNFYPLLVTYRLTVLATWRTNHLYALVRQPYFSSNKMKLLFS